MNFYAHTAELADGSRDSDESRWQRLDKHLRNVSVLAEKFAAPFGIAAEARLAGLLHDLGKYREEFQAYLRGERSGSVETQHAIYGAAWAAEEGRSLLASALAVAGHHAGLHDCGELAGMFIKPSLRVGQTVPQLIQQPYWRGAFARSVAEQEQESDIGLCLITGENGVPIARTHTPRIGNIPGVGIDGTIVSFEKSAPAFSSYGKVQSNNAPCSVSATRAYSKALQFLVEQVDHHVVIGKTKLCFWTKDQVNAASLFARLLNQPQQSEVKKFMVSPWSGIPRDIAHKDQFFAVTLAGNNSRIVIRHWLQQPLDRAIENLHEWFTDLELSVPVKPEPKAGKKVRPPGKPTEFNPLSVYWLACTMVREAKDLPTDVPAQLYRAALEGTAPAVSLLTPILNQLHSKIVRDENYTVLYDQSRFALLKLILNRNRKNTDMEIKPELTADTDDAAYNCGRLLAILAATQDKAHDYKLEGAGVTTM